MPEPGVQEFPFDSDRQEGDLRLALLVGLLCLPVLLDGFLPSVTILVPTALAVMAYRRSKRVPFLRITSHDITVSSLLKPAPQTLAWDAVREIRYAGLIVRLVSRDDNDIRFDLGLARDGDQPAILAALRATGKEIRVATPSAGRPAPKPRNVSVVGMAIVVVGGVLVFCGVFLPLIWRE